MRKNGLSFDTHTHKNTTSGLALGDEIVMGTSSLRPNNHAKVSLCSVGNRMVIYRCVPSVYCKKRLSMDVSDIFFASHQYITYEVLPIVEPLHASNMYSGK